jgi:hypothetical protein
VYVKISDTGDLGAVVDDLSVDVQDECDERILGIRAFGGSAWPLQVIIGQGAHGVDPFPVLLVELAQGGRGVGGVLPR